MEQRYLLPEYEAGLLDELAVLARRLEDETFSGVEASALLERYAELTGRIIPRSDFLDFHGSQSVGEFVARTLMPEWLFDEHVPDSVLRQIFASLRDIDQSRAADFRYWVQLEYWERILEVQLANPEIQTLLAENPSASPDELLAMARAKRPILL